MSGEACATVTTIHLQQSAACTLLHPRYLKIIAVTEYNLQIIQQLFQKRDEKYAGYMLQD
ncbi:hypothetical protein VCV18_003604 [Metarhizium anisopliae]